MVDVQEPDLTEILKQSILSDLRRLAALEGFENAKKFVKEEFADLAF